MMMAAAPDPLREPSEVRSWEMEWVNWGGEEEEEGKGGTEQIWGR